MIVEGYLDAIQAHQAGYSNVVAQMGTALTESQLKLLVPRLAKKIILSLDSDAAGQSATRRSLEVARETLQADYAGRLSADIRILIVPGAKDPDDLIRETPEMWPQLVTDALPVADYVIASEIEMLPEHASVQEREELAVRLLPILVASDSDLYKINNLQMLAMKLRINEGTLLAKAKEVELTRRGQVKNYPATQNPFVDREKFPKNIKGSLPESLEQEPPVYGDELPDFDTPRVDRRGQATAAANQHEAALEAYCLRVLFMQPKLIYDVNRKFRELADTNSALADGPLGDLSSNDFTRTSYRALMDVFSRALTQDEKEVLDFLHAALTSDLMAELETLLADEWEEWQLRQRNAFNADLMIVRKQSERFNGALDMSAEMVEKALRLRRVRLDRERQEIMFLALDGDAPYQNHIILSMLAKRLIEVELNRRLQLLRQ